MDDPGHRSPRRGLRGPRPAPLQVGKRSRDAKKPPLPPQRRPPVIIHIASPRVFHTNPSEFMSLVQHLTGARSGAASVASTASRAASESTAELELGTGSTGFDRTGVLSPAVNASNEFSAPAAGLSGNYSNYADNYLFMGPGNLSSSQVAPPPPPPHGGYWDLFDQDQNL